MKPSCPGTDRLPQLLNVPLPTGTAEQLAAHLEGCAACRAAVVRLAESGTALPPLGPGAPAARVLRRILTGPEAVTAAEAHATGSETLAQNPSASPLPSFGSY